MGRKVESGDTVAVHYTGTLDSGETFDTSRERDPIDFEVGGGKVIPGFDEAVRGMEVGDSKNVRIEPKNAYGERRDDLRFEVPRSKLPEGVDPQVGQALQVEVAPGQQHVARVVEVEGESLTLDLNHPLAGEALNFDLELVEIRQA